MTKSNVLAVCGLYASFSISTIRSAYPITSSSPESTLQVVYRSGEPADRAKTSTSSPEKKQKGLPGVVKSEAVEPGAAFSFEIVIAAQS